MRRDARPVKAKGKAKRPVARTSTKREASEDRPLDRRLAEVLEQQAATSEILRVISSSPTDVRPVFETIARNAPSSHQPLAHGSAADLPGCGGQRGAAATRR